MHHDDSGIQKKKQLNKMILTIIIKGGIPLFPLALLPLHYII